MIQKIFDFLKKFEPKIILGIGLILVAVISFEFGLIQGKNRQDKPLTIELPNANQNTNSQSSLEDTSQAQKTTQETKFDQSSSNIPSENCLFVGSKNSNKFHQPSCHFAKLIKPENLVCFRSTADAISKGRQGDKSCIK